MADFKMTELSKGISFCRHRVREFNNKIKDARLGDSYDDVPCKDCRATILDEANELNSECCRLMDHFQKDEMSSSQIAKNSCVTCSKEDIGDTIQDNTCIKKVMSITRKLIRQCNDHLDDQTYKNGDGRPCERCRESLIECQGLVKELQRTKDQLQESGIKDRYPCDSKGDYLSEVADLHGVSVPSASRILHSVCPALSRQLDNINFPTTHEELNRVKDGFYRIAQFPNVVGAVDGTLIPVQGMSGDDEPHFICRKGFPSINVQGVVDADLRFTNIVVKWPGSTHDSFILANSSVPQLMETLNGWILGDSGYPLKKWLLTPFNDPRNIKEEHYNRAHCSTRNTVERAFGVLKCRFRCLHKTGGSLQFTAPKCIKVIECCLRLHNMAINERLPLEAAEEPIQILHNNAVYRGNGNDGYRVRQTIAQRF